MDHSWNNILLVFNALLWLVTFFIYQKRRKYFGVGSGIILLYTIIAVVDIHLYHNPYALGLFKDLTLIPYLYLYGMIMLACLPIFILDKSNIEYIQPPRLLTLNVISILLIVISFIGIFDIFAGLKDGIYMLMIDSTYGSAMYKETVENFMMKTSSNMDILSIITNIARGIIPLFFIYYLILPDKNKYILSGLFIGSLIAPLYAISIGGRTVAVLFLMKIVFLFLFLRKFMQYEFRRRITRMIVLLLLLLLIPFTALTISRAGGDFNRMSYTIERYSSESFLNFNNWGLNTNGCRYGDRTVVFFKELLGMEPARYYTTRLSKYSSMNMNESVFYTFVGEFTLDYGPFISIVVFMITCLFYCFVLKAKNGSISFSQYILFYSLMMGCLGYFHFPWANIEGNLQLIALFSLAILFKYDFLFYKK